MFALRVEAKVNTVGSSSSSCKRRACTKHFPDRGFCFPKLIESREDLNLFICCRLLFVVLMIRSLFQSVICQSKMSLHVWMCCWPCGNQVLLNLVMMNWNCPIITFHFVALSCGIVVCGLAAKQSPGLRLTASLGHFLLAPSPLCSGSPQHPDHGKCTRPGRSRPQTGWPDKKTRAAFSTRLPIAAAHLSLCKFEAKENTQRDFSSSSPAHVIIWNAWLKWENTHSAWLVCAASARCWELMSFCAWMSEIIDGRNHDVRVSSQSLVAFDRKISRLLFHHSAAVSSLRSSVALYLPLLLLFSGLVCISSPLQTISPEAAKAHDVKRFNVAWILAVRILEGFFKGDSGWWWGGVREEHTAAEVNGWTHVKNQQRDTANSRLGSEPSPQVAK